MSEHDQIFDFYLILNKKNIKVNDIIDFDIGNLKVSMEIVNEKDTSNEKLLVLTKDEYMKECDECDNDKEIKPRTKKETPNTDNILKPKKERKSRINKEDKIIEA